MPVSAQAQDDEEIVLQLDWEHEFQFAGYSSALWQGYYKDAGLNVDSRSAITEDGRFIPPDAQLISDSADTASGALDTLIKLGQGENP
jgi:ABC-type nitrate/sulfonate/bicarbonate transport system substrate-binding protein